MNRMAPYFQPSVLCKRKAVFVIIVALFVALNVVLYVLSPPNSFVADDTDLYLKSASEWVSEGKYNSGIRIPGYPMLLATLLPFGNNLGGIVVLIQMITLLGTAFAAMKIAERFFPHYGIFIFLLVVFNPVALLYSQLILPDNVFSFLFIVHVLFVIKAYRESSVKSAVLAGITGGVLALLRGNGLYVILVMPILLIVGGRLAPVQRLYKRLFVLGGVSLAAAFMVLSPWVYHQWVENGHVEIVTEEYRNYVIWSNVVLCEMLVSSSSKNEASKAVYRKSLELSGITSGELNNYGKVEMYRDVAEHGKDILLDYPSMKLIQAAFKAVGKFFFSNGASGWLKFFGLQAKSVEELHKSSRTTFYNSLSRVLFSNIQSIAIFAIVFGFLFIMRILNILGCVIVLKKREWEMTLIVGGYIFVFAFITAFLGYSRYRLPIDPLLAILAVRGILQLKVLVTKAGVGTCS